MSCGTPALVSEDTAAGDPRALPWLVTSPLDDASLATSAACTLARLTDDDRKAAAAAARRLWSWQSTADSYYEVLQRFAKSHVPELQESA